MAICPTVQQMIQYKTDRTNKYHRLGMNIWKAEFVRHKRKRGGKKRTRGNKHPPDKNGFVSAPFYEQVPESVHYGRYDDQGKSGLSHAGSIAEDRMTVLEVYLSFIKEDTFNDFVRNIVSPFRCCSEGAGFRLVLIQDLKIKHIQSNHRRGRLNNHPHVPLCLRTPGMPPGPVWLFPR